MEKSIMLNNEEYRKARDDAILKGVVEFGDYLKTARQQKRVEFLYLIGVIGIIGVLVIGGLFYTLYRSNWNLNSVFDTDTTRNRIQCSDGINNATLRDFESVKALKDTFPTAVCEWNIIN